MYLKDDIIAHRLIAILILAMSMLFILIPALVSISNKHSSIVEKSILILEIFISFGVIFFVKKISKMYLSLVSMLVVSVFINISYTHWLQTNYFPEKLLDKPISSKPTKPRWYK